MNSLCVSVGGEGLPGSLWGTAPAKRVSYIVMWSAAPAVWCHA